MPGVSELSDVEMRERIGRGDRRALAEMLTRVERGGCQAPARYDSTPIVVGVTGSGGAGKSTLVAGLIKVLRARGNSVAVLANDPQSPLTGGALLGDRIRVVFDPADDGVFFRSLSTRGAAGGVSAATGPAIGWLAAAGFDVVLVETVGVGQDQVAVRPLVDVLVLLVTPGAGDEVQWEKAGLIEVADIIAVNKCDLPGANRVRASLASSLALLPGSQPPPILPITAATEEGVAELWRQIEDAADRLQDSTDSE